MPITRYRKWYYLFSALLILVSVASIWLWELNFGIDFTGGSLMEVEYKDARPPQDELMKKAADAGLGDVIIQSAGERGYILRFKEIDEKIHQSFLVSLGRDTFEEKRFETVGSIIGKELRAKAELAIGLVIIAVLLYIAWAFRRVSRPISPFRYGIFAIVALFHDVFIIVGLFSILGHFFRVEIGIPFVAVLLTVLGYSVQDTIIVFDRIRENLTRLHMGHFEDLVNRSINETMARSLNTSLTTIISLLAIFFFGGETLKYFSLALIGGIAIGTYSSIFTASQLLVTFQHRKFFNIF